MKRCNTCGLTKPLDEFGVHRGTFDGLQARCRPCHSAAVIVSQRRHRERVHNTRRAYQARHPERYAQKLKRDAAWRTAKARDSRLSREERSARTVVMNAHRVKTWKEAHPERMAELGRRGAMRYHARKNGAEGSATADQIAQRWAFYGGLCWMCGDEATQTDHVIPIARGGSDWPANQRPACRSCNQTKNATVLDLSEIALLTRVALAAQRAA